MSPLLGDILFSGLRCFLPRRVQRLLRQYASPVRNRSIKHSCAVSRPKSDEPPSAIHALKCSIVATVKDEGAGVEAWLDSILAQEVRPNELVIVDGGSCDDTLDNIERWLFSQRLQNNGSLAFPVRVIEHQGASIAQGRNIGAVHARCEHLLFTDAGCVLEPSWATEMLRPFAEDSATEVVKGWYHVESPAGFLESIATILSRPLDAIDPASFLPSARSLAVRKSLFLRAGGFPTYLSHAGEDTFFALGALQFSSHHSFAPEAVTTWQFPDTPRKAFSMLRAYAQGDAEAGAIGWAHYIPQLQTVAGAALELLVLLLSVMRWFAGSPALASGLFALWALMSLLFRGKTFFRHGRARFEGQHVQFEHLSLLFVSVAESLGFLRGLFRYEECVRDRVRQAQAGVIFILTDSKLTLDNAQNGFSDVLSHSIALSEEGWLVLLQTAEQTDAGVLTHPRIEILEPESSAVSRWLTYVLEEREKTDVSYLVYADDEKRVEASHAVLRETGLSRMQNTNRTTRSTNGTHPRV